MDDFLKVTSKLFEHMQAFNWLTLDKEWKCKTPLKFRKEDCVCVLLRGTMLHKG